MVKCRKCGKEVESETKFCPACGTNLKKKPIYFFHYYFMAGFLGVALYCLFTSQIASAVVSIILFFITYSFYKNKKKKNITNQTNDTLEHPAIEKNIAATTSSENTYLTSFKEQDRNTLQMWVDLFNKAIEDKLITEEELSNLNDLQYKLGIPDSATKKYWDSIPGVKFQKDIEEIEQISKSLDSLRINSEWQLVVSFGKSTSTNFKQVLASIESYPSFKKYEGQYQDEIYEIAFLKDDLLNFDRLWERIKSWKSVILKVNDEIVDKRVISDILRCYRDNLTEKEINPLFCYGASPYTFNIFGCHRSKIRDGYSASQICWYNIGKFDKNGRFIVDKKAITDLIIKNCFHYRYCPALDIDNIIRGINLLPEVIDPRVDKDWIIENTYNGRVVMPKPKYTTKHISSFTEKSGQYQINVMTSMADYYTSVSPQFSHLIDKLNKERK